jgi:hypothetical protein
MLLALVSG